MTEAEQKEGEPTTRRAMRKALVRLHMETHRDTLNRETSRLLQPMHRAHDVSDNVKNRIKGLGKPVWAGGAAVLLLLIARRRGGRKSGRSSGGGFGRLVHLGLMLAPAWRAYRRHQQHQAAKHPSPRMPSSGVTAPAVRGPIPPGAPPN